MDACKTNGCDIEEEITSYRAQMNSATIHTNDLAFSLNDKLESHDPVEMALFRCIHQHSSRRWHWFLFVSSVTRHVREKEPKLRFFYSSDANFLKKRNTPTESSKLEFFEQTSSLTVPAVSLSRSPLCSFFPKKIDLLKFNGEIFIFSWIIIKTEIGKFSILERL